MRLTLRTLLAYLDDVLSPQDSKALSEKIEKNEFAAGIVKRINVAVHRRQLGAPELDAKEVGLDANLVAEYLDSTLPPEQMPDLEKACLESDVYLAEVAACHQILTLVLGEPASVDPGLRDRIHKIGRGEAVVSTPPAAADGNDAAMAAAAAGVTSADHAMTNGAAGTPTPKALKKEPVQPKDPDERIREVPEYLREKRPPRIWPLVATVAATFLIALAVLRYFGQFDSSHPIVAWMSGQPAEDVQVAQNDPEAGDDDPKDRDATETQPVNKNGNDEADDDVDAASGTIAGENDNTPGAGANGTTDADDTPVDPMNVADTGDNDMATDSGMGTDGPDVVASADPIPMPPTVDPMVEPMPAVNPANPADPTAVASADPVPAEVKPAVSVDVGRFTSDAEVLALYQSDKQIWTRLPARAPLVSGTRLCALPLYRPQMTLAGGVQLTLIGPTVIDILPPTEDGIPVLRVEYGRMVAITVGKVGAKIVLEAGGERRVVTFADVDSTAGISVRRYLPPGANPLETERLFPVEVFVSSGSVNVESDAGLVVGQQGQVVECAGDEPMQVAEAPAPDWMSGRDIRDIERRASRTLEELLPPEKALGISLLESVEDRRAEVRALAVDSLAHLGQYEPLFNAIGDEDQRTFWPEHFDALKTVISIDRDTAAALLMAATKVRGADADGILRQLWGYAPEELAAGEAAKLVAMLDNESLDVRVLAFENLRRITGVTHTYRPEQSESRRRTPLKQWRDRLERGEIVYATPPKLFPMRVKVTANTVTPAVEPAVRPMNVPAGEDPATDGTEPPALPDTDAAPGAVPDAAVPDTDADANVVPPSNPVDAEPIPILDLPTADPE